MEGHVTPGPAVMTSPKTPPPEMVTKETAIITDDGDVGVLIGVTVVAVLLLCIMMVLLWCLSRHKGSYVTNERDDEDMDEESDGSDTSLQDKEPLRVREEE